MGLRYPSSRGRVLVFFFFSNVDTKGLVFKVRTKLRKSVLDPVVVETVW